MTNNICNSFQGSTCSVKLNLDCAWRLSLKSKNQERQCFCLGLPNWTRPSIWRRLASILTGIGLQVWQHVMRSVCTVQYFSELYSVDELCCLQVIESCHWKITTNITALCEAEVCPKSVLELQNMEPICRTSASLPQWGPTNADWLHLCTKICMWNECCLLCKRQGRK